MEGDVFPAVGRQRRRARWLQDVARWERWLLLKWRRSPTNGRRTTATAVTPAAWQPSRQPWSWLVRKRSQRRRQYMHRLILQSMSSGLLAFFLCGCARKEPYADEVIVIQPVQFYDIKQVDTPPKVLSQVSPVYPFELRRNGYQGEALVGVFVSADGSVSDSVIWRATDFRFGECARQALLKWRYKPAEIHHHPVACALAVRMKFAFLPDETTQVTTGDDLSLDEIKSDLANHPLAATPGERPPARPTPSPSAPQR